MNLFELFVKIGVDDKASPAMKNTQKNSETLTNKIKVMSAQFEAAQKNVDKLTKEFNDSVAKTGAASKETQELAKKLDNAEKEAEQAKNALDRYNSELEETGTKSEKAGAGLSNFSSKLGEGIATAAKIGAAAVGAAAAGITALTTAAVNNYAEYEQLVGGVETLFKTSSDKVMEYAENAYKTAGMSANEYMETVTSFSASLLQSLDGDTAAASEKANLAITDMSDNANKMGTSMEMIQNAYQGFAKQNYTMLDNLKLGYGGTKEEMQRLLDKANELNAQQGIITDYQIDSYADIVDAIHVVQTEMGITGTTAKEAGTTIQGSVASMKSAWTNLLTGLADGNADIEDLVNDLVETVVGDGTESNLGVLGNILPAVETALNGASTLVSEALPKIMEIIPEIINENLPILAEAAVGIIQSLVDGISQNQEMLFETIFGVVTYLAESFITMLPQIVELGLDLIVSLANGIAESLPELIPTIVDVVLQIVDTLIDNVDMLIDSAIAIIVALADGLINSLPELIAKAPEIIENLVTALVNNAPKLLKAALEIIVTLAKGLVSSIPNIVKVIPQIVKSIVNGFASLMGQIIEIGKNIARGVWEGISAMASWITKKVKGFFSGIVNGVKSVLGIKSPSKVFASIGGYMAEGLGKGWDDKFGDVRDEIDKSLDFGDPSMKINASVNKIGAEAAGISGMAYGGTSIGNVTINIDGAKYSNENSLAEAIADALQNMTDRGQRSMLNETFYLDGIDANSVGIKLQSPVEFSEAIPVFESQTVPGRNGDLIFETGSYKNRVGSASCFCLQEDVERLISSAGRFLMGKKGYRRLETSDDPNHYWMARVENSPQIEMRLRTISPFEIRFNCKPQRFVKSGENVVVFTSNGSISNQYGQVALPLITLYGQGTGILKIGDCAVGVKELDGVLFLDSDTQNAYNDNGNQNMNINAKIFPTLPSGDTQIAFKGGIDRVEIVPRWWEL